MGLIQRILTKTGVKQTSENFWVAEDQTIFPEESEEKE